MSESQHLNGEDWSPTNSFSSVGEFLSAPGQTLNFCDVEQCVGKPEVHQEQEKSWRFWNYWTTKQPKQPKRRKQRKQRKQQIKEAKRTIKGTERIEPKLVIDQVFRKPFIAPLVLATGPVESPFTDDQLRDMLAQDGFSTEEIEGFEPKIVINPVSGYPAVSLGEVIKPLTDDDVRELLARDDCSERDREFFAGGATQKERLEHCSRENEKIFSKYRKKVQEYEMQAGEQRNGLRIVDFNDFTYVGVRSRKGFSTNMSHARDGPTRDVILTEEEVATGSVTLHRQRVCEFPDRVTTQWMDAGHTGNDQNRWIRGGSKTVFKP